jgi:hypothetical protein
VAANPNVRLLPLCKEKQRLRGLYREADVRYSAAVNALIVSRGKTSAAEYSRLRGLVDEARNTRNAARLALDQHKQEHGC